MDERGDFTIPDCIVAAETKKAVKILDGTEEFWVPKSQITEDSEVWDGSVDGAGPGVLHITRWFAEKQGWL